MNTYTITLPAFSLILTAKNQREALEQFWFEYDEANGNCMYPTPIIKPLTKPTWTKRPN